MPINPVLGSALLVAGTSIGAGILALPIAMAHVGYSLSLVVLLISWLAFYWAARLILEVNLWFEEGGNFITMSQQTLGSVSAWITWLMYLLLLYSLIAAYLTGGAEILNQILAPWNGARFPPKLGGFVWAVLMAVIIWHGPGAVDLFNRIFLIGLILGYIVLISISTPHIESTHLLSDSPPSSWGLLSTLPVVAAAYGFHTILPTIRVYLKSSQTYLKRTVIFGSLIPLIVYVAWNTMMFGMFPQTGTGSLLEIQQQGGGVGMLIQSLQAFMHTSWLMHAFKLFSFAALASSFLGVATSLFDFIADGLHIHKTRRGKMALLLLTFGPALVYGWLFPEGFVLALSYAGLFVSVLFCILPVLMVLKGRRTYPIQVSSRNVWGLAGVFLFGILIIVAAL